MSAALAKIQAGICGFLTEVRAEAGDDYAVRFQIESGCEKVRAFGAELAAGMPLSALAELRLGADGEILSAARRHLRGCCAACVTPDAVFKAMQVAAGLALPAPVRVELELES